MFARGCLIDRQLRVQVIDRLLPGPTLRVQPGVDDEPGRAFELDDQRRDFRFGVAVQSQFLAERRGIQTPTLDKRRGRRRTCEISAIGVLLLDGDLKMVPGHCFAKKARSAPPIAGCARSRPR